MKEPIWLSVMRILIGVAEIAGSKSNPMILNWARDIGAPSWFNNDDQAWCAVGMNRVLMACQMPMARHPTKPDGFDLIRAATFEVYGIPLTEPTLGCFLTFHRPGGDHIGLYLGEDKDCFYVLGANQANTVTISRLLKERLTSMRWPKDVPLVQTGRIILNGMPGQTVSVNED